MTITNYLLAAFAVFSLLQLVLLMRLAKRVTWAEGEHERRYERVNERLAHFAEALTLLTDTTEQGLANVANALEVLGRSASTRGTTKLITQRIMNAVRSGRSVSAIAAEERMSESEIGLHLGLGGARPDAAEAGHGALRV